ncbi:MAG: gliding motility-associated C-terminal domain-containing protein [Ferruginibacter sp.]
MRKTILLLIILINGHYSNAQKDTTFWFAAPDISSAFNYDKPVHLRLSSYNQNAVVSISMPANPAFPIQNVTIPAFTTQSVDLTNWLNLIECGPGNVIQNKGIKISSNNNIAVYYEVDANGANPELFALKGRNALGNQFYISSQYILNNTPTHTPIPLSSFNIVASENNTTINIRPSANITGHLANISFAITLNRGQTYAAIATSPAAANHLHGSFVNSDKPIAITIADDLLQGIAFGGICEDLAGDQTVPINILGDEYIAIRSNLNQPDKLYITGAQNGTTVKQDGALITTLNAGQSTELTVANNTSFIQLSAPAYAYHLAGIGCEVGSAILPKITCTGSSSVSVTRSTSEAFYVTLLVKAGSQNGFRINNSTTVITGSLFAPVPFTSGVWYWAKIFLSLSNYPNGSVIKIDNVLNVFQLGVMQGGSASGASYGYFSDYNTFQANATTLTPSLCTGSSIILSSDTISSAIYSWTGPNNFTSNLQNVVINNASQNNSGNYILNVTVPNCGTYIDTINITVKAKTFSNLNLTICQGQSYAGYTSSGLYVDTLIGTNGCDSIRTLNLNVMPRPIYTVNASICFGESYLGYTSSGTYLDTIIVPGGCDSIRTLNLIVMPMPIFTVNATICLGESYLGYTSTGTYLDTIIVPGGCDSIRTLQLLVTPAYIQNINKSICKGENYFGYTLPGIYRDTIPSLTNCDSIRIINLKVSDNPKPSLEPEREICAGQTIILNPGIFQNSTYIWSSGSVNQTFAVSVPGIYSITVINACGSGTASTNVKIKQCAFAVPNTFTPNGDGKNETFKILNLYGHTDFNLDIFNRWGELVFQTKDVTKGWDGKIKGINADWGSYVWHCTFKKAGSQNRLKGNILLIR